MKLQEIYNKYKTELIKSIDDLKNKKGSAWECYNKEFEIKFLLKIANEMGIKIKR